MGNHNYKMLHDSGKYPLIAPEWFVLFYIGSIEKPIAFCEQEIDIKFLQRRLYPRAKILPVKDWVNILKDGE